MPCLWSTVATVVREMSPKYSAIRTLAKTGVRTEILQSSHRIAWGEDAEEYREQPSPQDQLIDLDEAKLWELARHGSNKTD